MGECRALPTPPEAWLRADTPQPQSGPQEGGARLAKGHVACECLSWDWTPA